MMASWFRIHFYRIIRRRADGLAMNYPNTSVPEISVNDILMNITNLSGIFLPVNKHGTQGREAARMIEEAYASENQILYYPAGLCSRKKKGIIRDLQWHKSFISKSIQYKRDIVPAFFSGRNSNFFYNLSNFRNFLGIKANIEMLYLVDELFKQKGKEIDLIFGKAIPWQTFDSSKTTPEWAEWVKGKSYDLNRFIVQSVNKKMSKLCRFSENSPEIPIITRQIKPMNRSGIDSAEFTKDKLLGTNNGNNEV
jgi:hypothetical protein